MSRPTSVFAAVAGFALLLLGSLAIACGEIDQAQPQPVAASDAQEEEAEPVAAPKAQESERVESDEQVATTREPQQRSQSAARQPQEQSDGQDAAEDQAEQSETGERTAEAESEAPSPMLRPILGGYQFHQPIEMLTLPDGSLLVAEQRGYITRFVEDDGEIKQFGILDLTESTRFGGEQGLLSMALHPDVQNEPFLYVYYSPRDAEVTRLSRFRFVQGEALEATELVIMEVPQPYPNHNGGAVRFGSDGMLYLGYGDGGAANDPHGHGQNRETLLGTIVRINVNDIDTSTPYRIPTDNPFLGIAGVRPEIWAYGLRNPWRMMFDPQTDLLWVADVGQNRVEEIAIVQAGENHGWNVFEGDECFQSDEQCEALSDAVSPVAVYGHDEGCSVTGGMVYRGKALPHLIGAYIFGDYCKGTIWGLWPDDGSETGWVRELILESDQLIASFAADNQGEIHVLAFNGPILKLVEGDR